MINGIQSLSLSESVSESVERAVSFLRSISGRSTYALGSGLGIEHVAFAMVDPTGSHFREALLAELEVIHFLIVLHFVCFEHWLLFFGEVFETKLVDGRVLIRVTVTICEVVVSRNLIQSVLFTKVFVKRVFCLSAQENICVLRNEVLFPALRVMPVTCFKVVSKFWIDGLDFVPFNFGEFSGVTSVEVIRVIPNDEVGLSHLS